MGKEVGNMMKINPMRYKNGDTFVLQYYAEVWLCFSKCIKIKEIAVYEYYFDSKCF